MKIVQICHRKQTFVTYMFVENDGLKLSQWVPECSLRWSSITEQWGWICTNDNTAWADRRGSVHVSGSVCDRPSIIPSKDHQSWCPIGGWQLKTWLQREMLFQYYIAHHYKARQTIMMRTNKYCVMRPTADSIKRTKLVHAGNTGSVKVSMSSRIEQISRCGRHLQAFFTLKTNFCKVLL